MSGPLYASPIKRSVIDDKGAPFSALALHRGQFVRDVLRIVHLDGHVGQVFIPQSDHFQKVYLVRFRLRSLSYGGQVAILPYALRAYQDGADNPKHCGGQPEWSNASEQSI
jgi:hypothetical protein